MAIAVRRNLARPISVQGMKQTLPHAPERRTRFSHRLVVAEEPDIARDLATLARQDGRSVAAEARAAIRHWLRTNRRND